MAKYRITSLPGYTKRVPLSKAQFGGLNKFLKGGDPCPPDKQVYAQFSKFGCISSSQYNKLIEQTKNNLLKQEVYKKTKLDDFNILRKSRTDGDWPLAEKLLVEWKAKYPGNSSVCPKDDCPEYDLVLEPDPIIPPEEIPEEIPELSLGTYPNPPIYHQTPTEIEIPTVRVEKGNTKSIKFNLPEYHKNNYLTGKTDAPPFHGKKPHHINYRSRRLDFDRKDIPRLIPSLVQKFTGYDDAYMNGYEDEEGNYIPGEFEKAEEENRQINFKGKSSLRDKKEQERYNKEWEQHNIEKAGIREYNLNLIKEAGISPEEYVKKYGEYKYGGLHKFVAGGPSACPTGQYWNGTKCVPVQGFNARALLTNAANSREAQAKAIEAAKVAKEKARVAKLSEEDKNYEHFLGAPPKKAKPKIEPIPGSMQLQGDPYAITYEGELEKALAALTPEERRALEEAQLAEEQKLLDEKSKKYSQYFEDNKYDRPLSNAFASDNTKVFNPLGPSSLEKNRNKYFQTEIEQEDFIMNEVLPFSKKKEKHYKNVEKSKGDATGDRYNEAMAAQDSWHQENGPNPTYNGGEMFDYNRANWEQMKHKNKEGYDPETKLYYTPRGTYDPATKVYTPLKMGYQGSGAVQMFYPEQYIIPGMGARAALIPLGETVAARVGASALGQGIKAAWNTALPLGRAITSATAGTLTPANLVGLGFGVHGATTLKPNLDKFIEKPNLETGIDLGFSGLEILGSPGVGKAIMAGAKPLIDLGKTGVNNISAFYNEVATGNSGLPIAWKIDRPLLNPKFTDYIARTYTDKEAELLSKYGRGMNLTPEEWIEMENLVKSGATDFSQGNVPISRIPLYYSRSEAAVKEAEEISKLKLWQKYATPSEKSIRTWSAGIPEAYSPGRLSRSTELQKTRLVIPRRYTKNLGNNFSGMPYDDARVDFIFPREGGFNKFASKENELMGNIPEGFRVIGRSKEDGFNNIIIKPIEGLPNKPSLTSASETVAPINGSTFTESPLLLPVGTTNEVRSTAGTSMGTTPLLNEGAIGFDPIITFDDAYNSTSNANRTILSRFLPEQNITREPSLINAEELYLNQNPFMEYEEYQAAVNSAERSNMANVADTRIQTEAIEAFEAARAEQQAAKTNYFQNPSSQDAFMRRESANRALAVAEENVSIVAPEYVTYDPAATIPGATTGTGGVTVYGETGNTQPIMSGSLQSGNVNLNSGAISSAALPAESRSFDGLSQALGTSPTKNVNYSSTTLDALTQSRPNNAFHNGQTIETQLSNITDPVDYANRLRELESSGSINRNMYDELSEGLIAHIDNTPNPSIRSDAALDIINVDPDIVYTGSKLAESEVGNWLHTIPEDEMNEALVPYNYDFDKIANFFADLNLSTEVKTVALNQIKDDYRYITEFGELNPNFRPIDFSTGQILSPKLLKANNIADYKTLKISSKSKDILNKSMYESTSLTTGTIGYNQTLNKTLPHLKNRSNILSDKELTKQLEAYEEAYAAVKGKGGKAEDLIVAKLEDLRGTKYLRTTYADQMRAAGKDPSEILEYAIVSTGSNSKSLIDKNGVLIGTVDFSSSLYKGEKYSQIMETGLSYKYHGHSLKHGKFKTWEQSQEALTKRYLNESLATIPAESKNNPIIIKGLTKQAETKAAEEIKQLQINNNNRFGEALYSGVNASVVGTRGRLGTRESFASTNLPDPITGLDIARKRAEHGWRSWGKQYHEGVPRASGYEQGPSVNPDVYRDPDFKNQLNSPLFILRKLGGDVSKLSKFTQ